MLGTFHIKNFRGCPNWELCLGKKTYIRGPNGSGKTHLLEGIHILAQWHLIYNDDPVDDTSFFLWSWQTDSWEKQFSLYRDDRSDKYAIQWSKVTRIAFRASLPFRSVFVSPFDMNLLYFAPSMRRDYIDSILERKYEQFRNVRRDYEGVMRQRNALLKNIREWISSRKELDFWDQKFATLATVYTQYRQKYRDYIEENMDVFQTYLPKYQSQFFYETSITATEDIGTAIVASLLEHRERDIITWHTHIGVHRDDFRFLIRQSDESLKDAHKYLSRWEVKLLLLSLKLIEVSFLSEWSKYAIILLIDDIFAELDETNIQKFLKSLRTYQTILTSQKPLPDGEDWSEFTCINLKDQ